MSNGSCPYRNNCVDYKKYNGDRTNVCHNLNQLKCELYVTRMKKHTTIW